jgi:hypothetical protein
VPEFTRTLAGLTSNVDNAALMQVTDRHRKANGHTQPKRCVQWLTEQEMDFG